MATLHDLVYCHREEFNKNVAVTYDDGEGKKHVITYSELYQVSRKVTNILQSCNAENEIVGVCVQMSEDIPAILLGILPVPAAFYFFEPNPLELISQALQKLSVGILIVDIYCLKDLECLLQTLGGERSYELLELKLIIIKLNRITRKKNFSDLAYCITTSGSTGIPKMVQVPHKCIIPNITYLRDRYGVTSEDVLFLAAPLTFDPSIIDIFLSMSSGARLLITSQHIKVQPMKLSKMLHDYYHVTILQVTPSLIFSFGTKLLKETILSSMSSLRILAMGGETFPPVEVIKLWRADGNGTKFYNLYGLTEISCWSSCYEVIEEDFSSNAEIPIGNAMYGTSLVVFDEHGQTVTNGHGWLHTGGPNRVCEINENTPCNNLYNTGDWVKVDELGKIFYIQRKDEQIKRAGKRLNLQEIDSIMLKELSFIDNCKTTFSDGRLILLYKLSEDEKLINKTIIEEKMKQTLKKFLPSYYQPDYLVKVDFFPLNHHGKLNILPLIEMLKENIVMHNSVEEVFLESWKVSLNLSDDTFIEPSANFVAGGGNSLMAVHFIDQLELNLGIQLSSLIQSVLYKSYNETLSKLKELIYNHEGKVPVQVLAMHKEGMKSEITKNEGMKNETANNEDMKNETANNEDMKNETAKNEGMKNETAKNEGMKNETAKNEGMKNETAKSEDMKNETAKSEDMKNETARSEDMKNETTKSEDMKNETAKSEDMKNETAKSEDMKNETARSEDMKNETARSEDMKNETARSEDMKNETARSEDMKNETTRSEDMKNETARSEDMKNETARSEDMKNETARSEDMKNEMAKNEDMKNEMAKSEDMKNEIAKNEDMKNEIKNELLFNIDASIMENTFADMEEGLLKKLETHLNKNETSINDDQTLKADSLCPEPSNSDSIKKSSSARRLFGSSNAISAEKRTMFKNEHQVPPKLIKKKENEEFAFRIGSDDKDLNFADKSQVICSHKRKMIDVLWSFNTGKCVDASAVISSSGDNGGVVFIGSHSHRFFALLEKNGELLWEVIFGDRIESSACLSQCQKYVIVGCYDSCVYILKVETGEIHWKIKTGDVVKCSPVLDPLTSLIWIGSHDECIYSLDIKSRSNKIKKNLQTGSIFSSPSICTNPHQVYISTLGGYLYSMDPFDGSIKWKEDFGKPVFTSPCVTSNGVVVGCVDGRLYALDHAGNRTWKLDTDGQIFSSPICMLENQEKDKEIIVCGSFSQFIFCSFINGNLKWKTNIHSKIYAAPCSSTNFQESDVNSDQRINEYSASATDSHNQLDDGFIAISSTDGNLQLLCVKCGFIICEYKLPGEVFSSPIVCREKIFLGCRDDKVYCLKIDNF